MMNHITFDYGGYYEYNGGDTEWHSRQHNSYTIYKLGSAEEFRYEVLVDRIRRKVKANPSTMLRLSHFAYGINPKKIIYIVDDEDASGFLSLCEICEHRCLLHVEVVEGVEENMISERVVNKVEGSRGQLSRAIISAEEFESNARINDGENAEHNPPELHEALDIVQYSPAHDIFEANVVENRDTNIVEPGEGIDLEWEDGIDMSIGQEFESKRAVQDLIDIAIHRYCFDVITVKSSKTLYVLKCRGNDCKWSVRVAKMRGLDRFSVRTYNKMHTCSRLTTSTSRLKKKGTPRLVASVVHEDYPGQFDIPSAKQLISLVQRKVGVKVSYDTALRGKKLAVSDVRGSPEESYKLLPSYLYMLEKMNDGTITRFEFDEQQRFKCMFFALGACIEGFKSMRKVIIIDGTFLKNVYGRVLIIATAQDPDRHHYPLAFGVVDGENDSSWRWFLQMLKSCIPDSPVLVIVSDRNASIIKTVGEVFPNAKHGFCMWHLSQNVKSHVSGVNKEVVARKFRECAQVYTQAEFIEKYTSFKITYPKAGEYLDGSVGEIKWARCFFPGERYNIDTTNCAESLNAIFKDARKYSLLPMIDVIVGKIVAWFNKHRRTTREISSEHKLVPYVASVLHSRCEGAKLLEVKELNGYVGKYYMAGRDGNVYYVDLESKTCSCKHFDVDRYPCEHAIASVMFRAKMTDVDLHTYCSYYYSIEQWVLAYHRTIYPVPHFSEWNVPEDVAAICMLPPEYKKKKGRNKERRFPSVAERRRKNQNIHGLGKYFNV